MNHSHYALAALLLWAAPSARAEEDIRILLVPRTETTLSSQVSARISKITVKEGDAFKRGAPLVEFDCRLYQAQLAKARAQLSGAKKTHEANLKLQKFQAIGEVELAVSEAEMGKAQAEIQVYNAQVELCRINAPFDGRVVKRHMSEHASTAPGDKLLDILDDSQLEMQLHVPSAWLSKIKSGTRFSVRIDEIGQTYPAEVMRVGAKVDPVSRTIELFAKILEKDPRLLAGMSGVADFGEPQQ